MANNNVLVNNLCSWPLYFSRATGNGEVMIPANVKNFALISFEEAQVQVQMGNIMFTGEDGLGSHARIQFVDDNVRKAVFGIEGLDVADPVQLDEKAVTALFQLRSKEKFKNRLAEIAKTDAEKKMLLELAEITGAENFESWKMDMIREAAKL